MTVALALGLPHAAVADEYLAGTNDLFDTAFSGETVTGGTGSGGGAGLGGALFVGDGATVNLDNVDFLGNTAIGGTGGVGDTGGGLNGRTTGTPGADGATGDTASDATAYVNGGDGGVGGVGFNGENGVTGVGGDGGDGGEGSDGSATTADIVKTTAEQAKAIFDAAGDGTEAGLYTTLATQFGAASAAAGVGGTNAGGPAPNPALATALATVATSMTALASAASASSTQEGVKAAYELAYLTAIQVTAYATGAAGNGGDGGAGGAGGIGSFGYGGGAGGDGGGGGDAIDDSAARGGTGGDGGAGGRGGFGAGGGKGGNAGIGGGDGLNIVSGSDDGIHGAAGIAGFGGGIGSVADGTTNGYGGGGGSAFGGAIFVASGGTLNMSGNATFDGNTVFGGSSLNGGAAGQAAGSDLFMMTGSNVILSPGAGNTITFNGAIADDSRASVHDSPIASGQGAGIEITSGLVVFNGVNTYTGQTMISGGVLQADDGTGIHADSNINLAGGVLQTTGVFDRHLGTAAGRLQWTGSGGFSAIGGDLTVSLNNGAGLTWDSGSFVGDGDALLFGSDSADSDVYFSNAIDFAGGTRTIVNNGGVDAANLLYLDGVLSNGSAVFGDGTTVGSVVLTAANIYAGSTSVAAGTTLLLNGAGSIATSSGVEVLGDLDIADADSDVSLTTLSGSGTVTTGETGLIVTNGSTDFSGVVGGEGSLTVSGGTQSLSGTNTYTGKTTVDAGAQLTLKDGGSIAGSSEVAVEGTFDIATTTTGAEIKALTGGGSVALGSKTLAFTDAFGTFSGVISGVGGNISVDRGTQTLTGVNTYTGGTTVMDGAKLVLSGDGSIATSSGATVDGEFDIAATTAGATVRTLAGGGDVTLGDKTLTVSDGSTTFSGVIDGAGGMTVTGGTQTLTGVNTYEGATTISGGATLALSGGGSIEQTSGVQADGTFDISATTDGATIDKLTGSGSVALGSKLLAIADADGTFSGVIGGAGALSIDGGTQTLSGANTYSGTTTVAEGATLALTGTGGISASQALNLFGAFDISGTTSGASFLTLQEDGTVALGTKRLVVTDGSTTFSGEITGTGGFEVSGGTQTLQDVTSSSGLLASSGGTLLVNGGSVDGGTALPALSIVNGGAITTTGTSLDSDMSTAFASFDEAGAVATFTLAAGTTIVGHDGTLLLVERSGDGSDGIVNFIIDNEGVANGDIIDRDPKTGAGGTDVIISEDASWEGLVDAASFYVESGGSAVFDDGSRVDGNLTAEAGASVLGGTLTGPLQVLGDAIIDNGAITGNVYIVGSLNLNGLLSPGNSPGVVSVQANLNNAGYADSLFEVRFGEAFPVEGTDYDQLNVGGDISGSLPVTLANYDSDRGTELGNIGAIELIRVGGAESENFTLTERFTQNGHEVVLDRRTATASDTDLVQPANTETEEEFFGAGDLIVYGLDAFVQDETIGLSVLTGTDQYAAREMLGTMVDRRGVADEPEAMKSAWLRAGGGRIERDDVVDHVQRVFFTSFGADIVRTESFRAGFIGGYSSSSSDVETNTGPARLGGQIYAGGVQANLSNRFAYVDAVGQFSYGDWTFNPTDASDLTARSLTGTALLEAGVSIGTEQARLKPWIQMAYQSSTYDQVDSAWVDNVSFAGGESLTLRGGLRGEAHFKSFSSFADVSVVHGFSDEKTVTVDSFEYTTALGGTQVEVGVGFDANLGETVTLSTNVKGIYAVDAATFSGYQGQARLEAGW